MKKFSLLALMLGISYAGDLQLLFNPAIVDLPIKYATDVVGVSTSQTSVFDLTFHPYDDGACKVILQESSKKHTVQALTVKYDNRCHISLKKLRINSNVSSLSFKDVMTHANGYIMPTSEDVIVVIPHKDIDVLFAADEKFKPNLERIRKTYKDNLDSRVYKDMQNVLLHERPQSITIQRHNR